MSERSGRSGRMEITATDLLASLAAECRKLVDASGLEDGPGGGWESYDCLLTEFRKRLKEAESYLVSRAPVQADGTCQYCGRDYSGDMDDADLTVGGPCPAEECPSNVEMKGKKWSG